MGRGRGCECSVGRRHGLGRDVIDCIGLLSSLPRVRRMRGYVRWKNGDGMGNWGIPSCTQWLCC